MAKKIAYTPVKYPRVMVSNKRHEALVREAARKNISVAELAEQKFALAK